MNFMQIPFFPASKPTYILGMTEPTGEQISQLYPELGTCLGSNCNSCTDSCPQNLEVLEFLTAAQKGDIYKVVQYSFDCIMCGLCAVRCPQGIAPYNIALLCRRLYGHHMTPRSKHLEQRIADIATGKYDAEIDKMQMTNLDELKRRYDELRAMEH